MLCPAPTAKSNVFVGPSSVLPIVLVVGGSVQPSAMAPTVLLDVPTHQETNEAFDKVSSIFKDMSEKHEKIQGVFRCWRVRRQAKLGELETTA